MRFIFLNILIITSLCLHSQNIYKGEKIKYNVSYGFITAGEVVVKVDSFTTKRDSTTIQYRAEIVARTTGVAGIFAKITDTWVSYIDSTTEMSHKFVREQKENNYTLFETTEFERTTNQAVVARRKENNAYEIKSFNIPKEAQDLVSGYFSLRTDRGERMRVNDTLSFAVFLEDTTYRIPLKYLGKDKLRTKIGKMKAYKFSPIVPKTKNSILASENPIITWISADEKRIPLKIEVNTKYGDIEVDIEEYQEGFR